MAMEFLCVEFNEQRKVIIDDVDGDWLTNEILAIEAGKHRVTLAPPPDFGPDEIEINLHNTNVLDPRIVQFFRTPR